MESPFSGFYKASEVAAALRSRADTIVARWCEQVISHLPQAEKLPTPLLEDHVPSIIQWLADLCDASAAADHARLLLRQHGELRFQQNFNLNELLIEYQMLRRIVLEEVAAELKQALSTPQLIMLNDGLDVASRRASVAFAEHLSSQLKTNTDSQAKYLSFLSHDLRGSLNGVLLMIEVLYRDLEGAPAFSQSLEDLDMMRRSIYETVGTMDRFLHAQKLHKGLFTLNPVTIKLESFMSELSRQFARQAEQKRLEMKIDVAADASIRTDRDLLNLVVHNLTSNAIKFSRNGSVTIKCRPSPAGEDGYLISVADEGPGIDQQKLEGLFEEFKRGDTHGEAGTGLGLSIARQAAELLRGKLWAESEAGKGTTFYLEIFPLLDPSTNPENQI